VGVNQHFAGGLRIIGTFSSLAEDKNNYNNYVLMYGLKDTSMSI